MGRVLNQLTIPVLPYALDLHILLKIFDLRQSVDAYLVFTNHCGEQLGRTTTTVLRNYRGEDQVPGVDKDYFVTLVITEPGIVHISCITDGEEAAWYPLTIRMLEEEGNCVP